MIGFQGAYGELTQSDAKYKVKPRQDLLDLLDTRPGKLLELGCADGTNLLFFRDRLAAQGVRVERLVGVDVQAIRDCPQYGEFEFVHATVEDFIDRCRERFDLIILSDIVEHLYNPWRTLTALRENLEPDGRVLISVPNLQNLRFVSAVASGNFHYQETGLLDVTHIRFFSRETLATLLNGCGYTMCRSGFRPDFALEADANSWRSHLAGSKSLVVSLGSCSVVIDENNIDLLCAQQLLVCARRAVV
jgi:2-polyprenyl-3-methyl-5-hydroxy-6-metoxy-1,4-benzoquinol methylase